MPHIPACASALSGEVRPRLARLRAASDRTGPGDARCRNRSLRQQARRDASHEVPASPSALSGDPADIRRQPAAGYSLGSFGRRLPARWSGRRLESRPAPTGSRRVVAFALLISALSCIRAAQATMMRGRGNQARAGYAPAVSSRARRSAPRDTGFRSPGRATDRCRSPDGTHGALALRSFIPAAVGPAFPPARTHMPFGRQACPGRFHRGSAYISRASAAPAPAHRSRPITRPAAGLLGLHPPAIRVRCA